LCLPVVSVDLIKAGIVFTLKATEAVTDELTRPGGRASQPTFRATYDLIYCALSHGVSVIAEKAWQRGWCEAELSRFLPIAQVIQLHLACPPGEARQRAVSRWAGMDAVWQNFEDGTWAWSDFGPVALEVPTMTVSTAGGAQVNPAEVECFMESVIRAGPGG
ncbi:MAG TPA: hypothetical protein VMF65_17670, partial [Acidimicrobiales bacterium]|nr:hypothetical protein [Acidimicrobiales bacterium]